MCLYTCCMHFTDVSWSLVFRQSLHNQNDYLSQRAQQILVLLCQTQLESATTIWLLKYVLDLLSQHNIATTATTSPPNYDAVMRSLFESIETPRFLTHLSFVLCRTSLYRNILIDDKKLVEAVNNCLKMLESITRAVQEPKTITHTSPIRNAMLKRMGKVCTLNMCKCGQMIVKY